jgi:hypothetical protein
MPIDEKPNVLYGVNGAVRLVPHCRHASNGNKGRSVNRCEINCVNAADIDSKI